MDIFNSVYAVFGRPAAAGMVIAGMAASAVASPVTLQPTAAQGQDAFVYQSMPTWNFDSSGFEKFIVLGKSTAGHDLNGLIKFDLTGVSLAPGETATLNLYVQPTESTGFAGVSPTSAGPAVAQVFAATSSWSAGSVNWNSGIAGGSLLTSQAIDGTGKWITFDVTSQVQSWVSGSATNNGFLLSQEAAVNSGGWVGLVFDSSAATNRPFLQVVPEPASLAGLAIIGGVLLRRRNRA